MLGHRGASIDDGASARRAGGHTATRVVAGVPVGVTWVSALL
jgi:hypothetical protein